MSDIVNIIPFLKLISVRKGWVAEVKGLFPRLTAVTEEAPIYVKW